MKLAADTNETIRVDVMDALRLTRGEPQVVVPVLTNALADSSDYVRARAAFALSVFGTNSRPAIPLLLRLTTETNGAVRDLAICALGEIRSEPQLVVPVLIDALGDRDEWIQANAADGLGNFGTNASSALHALIELYRKEEKRGPRTIRSDQPNTVRIVATSIKQIDPEAAAKEGIK